MDNLLIPASLVLVVTNLAFAALALSWKRKAKTNEHAAMGLALIAAHIAHDSFADGYAHGAKSVVGGMYLAAMRVDASEPILVALRATGRRLLGTDNDESVVQVPQEV